MTLPQGDGRAVLTHENPKHDCLHSCCSFNDCRLCNCADVREVAHCQHCYHCCACNSAVSRGCRKCACSPTRSVYLGDRGGAREWDSAGGVQDCSICYGPTVWSKYLEENPHAYAPQSPCMVDWDEEDVLDAVRVKIQKENEVGSHTPPGSPPQDSSFPLSE
ncbi:hypothetical protein P154DRAFT_533282 [Amniculicola lignicola CBS 123094]|uniref:Uncharacterized protein n=1 Tax=Amniculicola lignicola CBS 123094 TaxID=1392246 RepID=A0A6A5WMN3_9PLEO|nr:hypothetical protein P154DRAFT_533282 [Amniculicola lignicola CBS 123094]